MSLGLKPSTVDFRFMALHARAHDRSRVIRLATFLGAHYNNKEKGWMMNKHTAVSLAALHSQGYDVIDGNLTKEHDNE